MFVFDGATPTFKKKTLVREGREGRKGRKKRKEGERKGREEKEGEGKKREEKGRKQQVEEREECVFPTSISPLTSPLPSPSPTLLHSLSQAARSQKRDSAHQRSLRTADKQLTKFLQAKILEQMTGQKR